MRRLLWIFLIGLALSVLYLFAHHGDGTIEGLLTNDTATLIAKVGFLVFLGGTVLVLFRESFAQALKASLAWVALALLLAGGYTYRFELREVYNRVLAEIIPGRAYSRGRVVEIARGQAGEFRVTMQINGKTIPMALDTGASAVVLTQDAAKAAGLPLEVLSYTVSVDTANGRARAAAVTLDRIGVGSIVERSVPALIAQPGQLRTSLLGMSFLNRLEGWEVRG
ncbi:MAG: TIGR02281 family clan AA aspartic protease, partial [Pseudorhodoplanes sp.]